jgi:L-threonylcarbamoyladenylate synthase
LTDLDSAVAALAAGDVVGLPTETVYGLAADAANRAAVARIYRIKGRPADHPLIVHVLDATQARQWAEWTAAAERLADAFWPGPVTVVLRRRAEAPPWACAGHPTIALRCPAHPVARDLLRKLLPLGITGIAAPSANRFGRVSPTRAAHVRADLGDELPIVLEGGDADIGIESTIVDLSRDRPYLLRPGHVGPAALAAVLGESLAAADTGAPKVSGSLPSHYAPVKPLRLVPPSQLEAAVVQALSAGSRVAVWSVERPPVADDASIDWRPRPATADVMERELYRVMREMDAGSADLILVECPPPGDTWTAVADRLQRAAAPRQRHPLE